MPSEVDSSASLAFSSAVFSLKSSPAAAARVAVEAVEHLLQRSCQPGRAGIHVQQHVPVFHKYPNKGGQFIARPVAVDIRLPGPDRTAERNVVVKPGIVDRQLHRERQIVGHRTEDLVAAVFADDDLPVAQGLQPCTHDTPRKGLQARRFSSGLQEFRGIDGNRLHCASAAIFCRLSGCGYNGQPFIHSLSACQ